jgi:hypothetical protein
LSPKLVSEMGFPLETCHGKKGPDNGHTKPFVLRYTMTRGGSRSDIEVCRGGWLDETGTSLSALLGLLGRALDSSIPFLQPLLRLKGLTAVVEPMSG